MSAIPESALGEWIRHFRVQQRQIHNGRPWAQEDLAVAIGSNKSHINRIERGRQTPSGLTLQRICDALDLPWRDRTLLLNLAGYLPHQQTPSLDDVTRARSESRVFLSEAGHPLRLDDAEQRLRDLNELLAYVLFGRRREAVLDSVDGRHNVELLFMHPVGDWWQRLFVNYDGYSRWCVAALFEHCLRRYGRPELPPSLGSLAGVIAFQNVWEEMVAAYATETWRRPSNWCEIELDHPSTGQVRVQIQTTLLAQDERFSLTHYIPADKATRESFIELSLTLGRRSVDHESKRLY